MIQRLDGTRTEFAHPTRPRRRRYLAGSSQHARAAVGSRAAEAAAISAGCRLPTKGDICAPNRRLRFVVGARS